MCEEDRTYYDEEHRGLQGLRPLLLIFLVLAVAWGIGLYYLLR